MAIRILEDKGEISDGYHTFNELYEHRHILFIALCKKSDNVWKSMKHSDNSEFKGWFILGINRQQGKQITYHLPLSKWHDCDFAETLDKAPLYDNHKSSDVLKRIMELKVK